MTIYPVNGDDPATQLKAVVFNYGELDTLENALRAQLAEFNKRGTRGGSYSAHAYSNTIDMLNKVGQLKALNK